MKDQDRLADGTVLDNGTLEIQSYLGSGGFANTYRARDVSLDRTVAIKEYFPVSLAYRTDTLEVQPRSASVEKAYHHSLDRFRREAKTLARFKNPGIVRVYRSFEQNQTSYMVLEFIEGPTFEAWLSGLARPLTQAECDAFAAPLLDALELVHTQGILHRDVKPQNIIVRADSQKPVLLDFGSSRFESAQNQRTTFPLVSGGYSPFEAYSHDNPNQGPATDIYMLGATLFRAIALAPPPDAAVRAGDESPLMATIKATTKRNTYRPDFLNALEWALKFQVKDRPQSVKAWRARLLLGAQTVKTAKTVPVRRGGWSKGNTVEPVLTEGKPATAQPKTAAASPSPAVATTTPAVADARIAEEKRRSRFPLVFGGLIVAVCAGLIATPGLMQSMRAALLDTRDGPEGAGPKSPPAATGNPGSVPVPPQSEPVKPQSEPVKEPAPAPAQVPISERVENQPAPDQPVQTALIKPPAAPPEVPKPVPQWREIEVGGPLVTAAAVSSDGLRIAAAGSNGALRWWQANGGQHAGALDLPREPIERVAFGATDASVIAAVTRSSAPIRWPASGQERFEPARPEGRRWNLALAAGAGSDVFLLVSTQQSASDGGYKTVFEHWSAKADKPDRSSDVAALAGQLAKAAAIAPGGELVAVAGGEPLDHSVVLLDGRSAEKLASVTVAEGSILSVVLSARKTRLAAGGQSNTISVWDIADTKQPKLIRGLKLDTPRSLPHVTALAMSGDDRLLAAGTADGTVTVWNVGSGEIVRQFKGAASQIRWLAFLALDPARPTLLVPWADGRIRNVGLDNTCPPSANPCDPPDLPVPPVGKG